ncbi:hypothetical protein [Streptomyces purpurogeneiscleroticus]|uniref:hypothetical protein n=1 Tax=Streptomyces purpurogeneiscleroticus TaxID=68259 RepID=UPI001CBD0F72|nr:hypothetical protein [Streptomyces purpurogeneiscleroticus]
MWWLKARRVPTVLTAAFASFVALMFLVQNTVVVLPSFVGRPQVALSFFVPIPLVAGLMLCLESRIASAENSGVRSVALLDAALVAATMAASVLASVSAGLLLHAPQTATTGRNALFLTGLMLCGRAVVGQQAVMLPVAWLLLVVFVGFRNTGDAYPWTIVPEPVGALHALIGAVLMFVIGALTQLYFPRKTS